MTSKALTLTKPPMPTHESASTNTRYWRDRYPMLLGSMSAATGKAVAEVAEILVGFAKVPLASDGAVALRFMQEHVAS